MVTTAANVPTKWLSVRETAEILGISKCTLYRWIKRKWIFGVTLPNGTIRISLESVEEILAGR